MLKLRIFQYTLIARINKLIFCVGPRPAFRHLGPGPRGIPCHRGALRTCLTRGTFCARQAFWGLVRGLSLEAVVAWVPTRFNVADDPSRRVPPVAAAVGPLAVRPELWARAFRPALFPAFGALEPDPS